jgi:hypothetical protein
MSAEEYLRRSAELTKKQNELECERAVLANYRQLESSAWRISVEEFNAEFQRRVQPGVTEADRVVLNYKSATGKIPAVFERTEQTFDGGADIVVTGVHNLPTRARCAPECVPGHHSATEVFREVQDTGAYPTLEGHRARMTPAYEPHLDVMGKFTAHKLTKEQENAIRFRKAFPSV